MKLGPLGTISKKALAALDQIAEVLENVPKEEWKFVLKFAEEKAEENIPKKNNEK